MATEWNAMWDDEDWWKTQSATSLYVTLKDITKEEDKLKFRNKMMTTYIDADKSTWSVYDLLSFVQVAEQSDFHYTTDVAETKNVRRDDIEQLAITKLQELESGSEKNLSYYLQTKALREVIAKTTSSNDEEKAALKNLINEDITKIEGQLLQTEPDIEQATEFHAADGSGALEGVSDEVKQAFIKKIEQTFGWNLISAEQVKANDALLNSNIDLSVEISDDAGNKITNPIYAGCKDIPLSFSYPESFSDEQKQQFAYMYQNQLLANAAQRAAMELMKNPKLISEAQTKEDLVTKFADVVKQKYQHSVVIAALFSNEDLGKKIQFNKSMQLVADDTTDDDIQNILSKLENDEIKLDSDAIAMDTTALKWEIENAERIMKTKHIDVDALPFWKKATGAVNNWFNHITKRGGWKNLSVNALANGGAYIGATMLIGKGAAAVVATGVSTPAVALLAGGYALYAGWSYVSAKFMPAIDKLISEANQQQLGFKDTIKHIRKNFSRAKKEKQAEAEFNSRSNFRVGEGFIGGAATTAGAFAGNPLVRIITSAAAKTALLGKSIFNRNQSKENLQKNVNKSNLNAFKTAENYVTQDTVSLAAVVAGTMIARGVFGDTTPSSDTIAQEQPVNIEAEGTQSDSLRTRLDSLGGKGTPLDSLRAQRDSLGGKGFQSDSLRTQLDSLGGKGTPLDSLKANGPKSDEILASNSVAEGGNPVADGVTPAEFTPHTDGKTGMTVWQEAKTKGGVTETYLQDAKGNNFVRYEGLNTNHVVSEASYAKLIDTINLKGNTNFVMEDGSEYTFEQAVDMMREKLNADPDRLPDGIGTNRAIYLAMMRARYTGKLDIINDIKCNDNNLTALITESQKYATNPGHIGRLITDRPLPTRVGPASVITDPCVSTKHLGVNEAPDAEIFSAENDVKKLVVPTEKVDMADPYAEVRTTFDDNKGNYLVNQESVNGEYEKAFKDGSIWIDDKDCVTTTNGLDSNNREIHYHAPVDATPIINKLPNVPTHTNTTKGGITIMTYNFTLGKTVQVVLDPLKEGAEARTGHFFVDGKEYIIDAKSSEVLGRKISAPLNSSNYQMVDGAEQGVSQHLTDNVKDLNKGITKLNERIANIAQQQEGAIAGKDITVDEYNRRYIQTDVNTVTLTSEQTAEIRSKGEFVCTGIKDGKATMAVTGVEGVNTISVAAPTYVNMTGASDAVVNIKGNVYTATITTKEGRNLVVSIDNNIDPNTDMPKGTSITYDGKQVVLDSKTATAVEQSVETAFAANNVNVDVKAHTLFTEKIVKACEKYSSNPVVAKSKVTER